jgi:hypothetical protein
MSSLKDFAKSYEPKQMGNIADLKVVDTSVEIKTETRKDKDNQDYIVSFIVVNGQEFRVPMSIIEQLKAIIESKPDLKTFKVNKTGTGMGTKYQVIALD